MPAMNIGQAARASGLSAKMIRHYEKAGLIPPASRSGAGYRLYGDGDVHTLRFVRHARDLGFSIPEIAQLVGLWHDRQRPSREVKALAQAHIQDLAQKAQDLLAMKAALEHLVRGCRGDERPECPILETLAAAKPVLARSTDDRRRTPLPARRQTPTRAGVAQGEEAMAPRSNLGAPHLASSSVPAAAPSGATARAARRSARR